jgi:hypothetical protein
LNQHDENKSHYDIFGDRKPNGPRYCRSFEGAAHAVDVTAATFYEAVARGLIAMRSNDWAAEPVHGTVTVSVQNV